MIAAGPTVLWYAARSTGYVSLLLLTAVAVLGISTTLRWGTPRWPRFLTQALHRNMSLVVTVFLAIHVITAVADPFAGISLVNTIAPFTGSYRPIWVGLGVVALELMVALVVTSLVRQRISFTAWRVIHWLAYASWPAAILHTLGTGSDVRSFWAVVITLVCVGAVFAAMCWRLSSGTGRQSTPVRAAWTLATTAATIAVVGFAVAGPLQPGWARAAGTPSQLLTGASPIAAGAVPTLAANLSDSLTGSVTQGSAGGVQANLTSVRDRTLTVVLQVSNQGGNGRLVISQGTTPVCSTSAVVGDPITATCGKLAVTITVTQRPDGSLTGTLQTSGGGG